MALLPSAFSNEASSGKLLYTYLGILIALWTLIIGVSLWLGLEGTYSRAEEYARIQARTASSKDEAYRLWAMRLGGVYAPITDKTPPNPYLDAKNREVITPSLQLTKINPEYMLRLVHELETTEINTGIVGHIAGNNPLRPANKSDQWEFDALKAMNKDRSVTEVTALATINGKEYMRLIYPLIANSNCGDCHAGVKRDDLVGGLSVSVPMAPILASADRIANIYIISHGVLWVLGIVLFLFGAKSLQVRIRQRDEAERELRALTEDLENRVQEGVKAAAKREHELQAFMDNTDSGLFLKNSAREYVLVNKRFGALINKDVAEIIGRDDSSVLPATLVVQIAEKELAVMDSRQPMEIEDLHLPDKPGEAFSAFIFPIMDDEGAVAGVGGIVLNITQHRHMEEAMREARDTAEHISQGKSDFLANVSHEIRTPLNGVTGMADLLLRSNLTKEQAVMAATIKSSSDSLVKVLNDILDFSKIESGKMYLDPTPFSLRDMVFDAVANIVPMAYKKNLEVIVHVAPKVPDHLIGDWTRLRQVVLNLSNNAVKFTEKGEVTIAVRVLSQGKDTVRLRLSVTDTGIGIAPDKQKMIFSAFAQADSSTTRKYGGTGLGLAISTQLVKLMDSEMCLESSPGYGSSFWFDIDLPFIADDGQPRPMGSVQALKGIKALVVDDNPTNLHIFKEQLHTWDVFPQVCESAAEALRLLRLSVNKGEPFDIVLTDLQMPEMDGLGLLNAMRDDPELKNIPSVLLSSSELPGSALNDPVFNSNLTKPVRPEDLMRAMAAALGIWEKFDMNALQIRVFQHGKNTYETSLRILLVEDMEVNQMVGVAMLTELGHTVTVASNGQEALAMLKHGAYDVIFMDIQMPVMDGLQATQLIKSDPFLQHLPVIAMTAHALKGDKEKYLSQDMDAYIAKPMAMNELISVLNEIMVRFNLGAPLLPDEVSFSDDMAAETGTITLSPGLHAEEAARFFAARGKAAGNTATAQGVGAEDVAAVAPPPDGAAPKASVESGVSAKPEAESNMKNTDEAESTMTEPSEPAIQEAAGQEPQVAAAVEITETMLDQDAMDKVFAGHAKLIVQSMNLYLRDAPGIFEQISKAVDDGDNAALSMSAHTLKGITRYYTTGPGHVLCLELEMMGRESKLPAEDQVAREKVIALRGYLAKLQKEMEVYIAANSV